MGVPSCKLSSSSRGQYQGPSKAFIDSRGSLHFWCFKLKAQRAGFQGLDGCNSFRDHEAGPETKQLGSVIWELYRGNIGIMEKKMETIIILG